MKFENDKQSAYQKLLIEMSEQMACLLADGKAIELDHSRSGIKMYSFRRKHEIIRKGGASNE